MSMDKTDTPPAKRKTLRGRFRSYLRRNAPYWIILFFLTLFGFFALFHRMVITIQSGEAGVMYRRFFGGTVTDHPYPEGIYLIPPWDRLYVYNVRNQIVSHDFNALSKRGLPLKISLTIRYRPDYDLLGVLQKEVGPDYVNRIVVPEVEATIRAIIGRYHADEIYTTQRGVVERIVNESLEQSSQRYVHTDDVLITRVQLPLPVQKAIETKLIEDQKMKTYEFILQRESKEAERKRIEAKGIEDYQAIISRSLSDAILTEKGIRATRELATSKNSKIVMVGGGKLGLPLILGGEIGKTINEDTAEMSAEASAETPSSAPLETTAPTPAPTPESTPESRAKLEVRGQYSPRTKSGIGGTSDYGKIIVRPES